MMLRAAASGEVNSVKVTPGNLLGVNFFSVIYKSCCSKVSSFVKILADDAKIFVRFDLEIDANMSIAMQRDKDLFVKVSKS